MSKIALSPNPSGTGTLTISAPNTNVDRVLSLPDSAGTIATAESTLAQFNASGSAPVYACRAWVNFDGTNGSIRASGNVSSVTRTSTGRYTVNLTTAMPDANYTAFVDAEFGGGNVMGASPVNASSFFIGARSTFSVDFDYTFFSAAIFR